ncbi:MAG: PQQ-like beta-propeller repeat protein [Sedimentisphaerales bacterium]|nr:PQQ-like beta-propeller repeat protein [Sedimentisphaerales bacterium]
MVGRSLQPVVYAGVVCTMMFWSGIGLANDWPNWRGPHHNGISDETGWHWDRLEGGVKILWRRSIGTGFASVAVSGGRVYAFGNTGKQGDSKEAEQQDVLRCLDAATGAEVWKHAYVSPLLPKSYEGGPNATPTVEAGRVYTLSKHGHVFCVDAQSRAIIWQKHLTKDYGVEPPNWGLAGSPVIMGDLIVLNAGSYGTALRKQDGGLAWGAQKGPAGYASAVPYEQEGRSCAVILGHRELYGVVAATGQVLWKQPWTTMHDENIPDPIIAGDKLFVCSGLGTGAALFRIEPGGIVQLWRHKNLQTWLSSSVLCKGYIYGVDTGKAKGVTCLDFQTGEVKWSGPNVGVGSLMLADGKLIVLSDAGRLTIVEAVPDGYKELASAQILEGKCWTVPVLANGRIHARNAVGDLVCVDVAAVK